MDGKATNKHTLDFFETTVLECIFERQFQKSHELATLDDLELLKYHPDKAKKVAATQAKDNSGKAKDETPSLISITAELYLYDPSSSQFILQCKEVTASLKETNLFRYLLVISSGEKTFLSQPVENNMNPVFSQEYCSFIWVYHDEANGLAYSWSLKFANADDERTFREAFGRCMYETLNREKFEKVKSDDRQFLLDAYEEDVEMKDAWEEEAEEEEEEDSESDDKENEAHISMGDKQGGDKKNSQLAVGFKHHRAFVVRGDRIGVFKHGDENLEFAAAINNVATPQGQCFSPAKIMLHDQDSSMVMMNKENPNSLYRMDLEYGKVVEEWKVDENREVTDFTPDQKYAQMTAQQTFVGVSHNAVFRIDPRQAGTKLVESQLNQYKSKNDFSCATTTGKGELVVASNKGDLRLYNQLEKRAKTHLPGLGDPVTGIDVSEDGKYILSTCKTYLLVIDTESKDKETSGFQKSLGAEKPAPKRLQLKPEHVAWMNTTIQFTPARFNTGEDMEKTIVTTTGPYVITWNFRRVKAGRLYDYTIKKYPTTVVAGKFSHGTDNKVIVALPDDVTLASKKTFMSPKKAFAPPNTPVKSLRGRDAIVNSPF